MAALNLFQMVTKQMKLQVDIPLEDTEAQLDKVRAVVGLFLQSPRPEFKC